MLNNTTVSETAANENKKESSNMDTQKNPVIDLAAIQANLHIVQEQAKELEAQAEELLGKLRKARGTGDVTEQAKAARKPRQPKEQVEATLRGVSMNIAHISKATALSVNKVMEAVRSLRSEEKVVNVGSEDFPQWTVRIGDQASTQALNAEVKRLITERPMTTQELMHFTGARLSRTSGALIQLQRSVRVLNRGTARRAKWFLVDDRATDARLATKN